MIAELALASLLAANGAASLPEDLKDKAKAAALKEAKKQVKKKIPSRGSAAVMCTASRCDAGVAASFLRKESNLFRDRYWTMDAFLGKKSAGIAVMVEPFKRDLAGELRLFVGIGFGVELGARELEKLPAMGALVVKGTF